MLWIFRFFSLWPLAALHALGGALGWGVWVLSAGYRQRFRANARQAGVTFDAARLSAANKETLLAPDILPTFSVASFMAKGAVLEGAALEHKGPLALIELQNAGAQPTYVAGTENFYAITRYNWSSYYAMAVIELGREVARGVGR